MGGKPRLSLSAAWRSWVAESLHQGLSAEEIGRELRAEGVPAALALREVTCIEQATASLRARIKRAEILCDTRKSLRAGLSLERGRLCSREKFHARHLVHSAPILFEDACAPLGIVGEWRPSLLRERFADTVVRVSTERDASEAHLIDPDGAYREMRFDAFVDCMTSARGNNTYLISRNRALEEPLSELLSDITAVPEFLRSELCGAVSLWMGPAGTHTPLHHDTSHILFCQIYGKKRLRLVAPDDTALLFAPMRHTFYSQQAATEAGAQVFEVDLEPGQGVYLPLGWWHELEALTPSISLSFVGFHDADADDSYRPGSHSV